MRAMAGEATGLVERFIERWQSAGGSERANYQRFVHELCSLLELPTPDPAHKDAIVACVSGRSARKKRLQQMIDTLVAKGRVRRGKDGVAVTA